MDATSGAGLRRLIHRCLTARAFERLKRLRNGPGCGNVSAMVIGDRLRELREAKNLSQGDIEKRTGLLRCYTSRVENGHTVPSVETLEKYASALEVPLYKLFCDDTEPLQKPIKVRTSGDSKWGRHGKDYRELRGLAKSLSQMDDHDRQLLIVMAAKFAARNEK